MPPAARGSPFGSRGQSDGEAVDRGEAVSFGEDSAFDPFVVDPELLLDELDDVGPEVDVDVSVEIAPGTAGRVNGGVHS